MIKILVIYFWDASDNPKCLSQIMAPLIDKRGTHLLLLGYDNTVKIQADTKGKYHEDHTHILGLTKTMHIESQTNHVLRAVNEELKPEKVRIVTNSTFPTALYETIINEQDRRRAWEDIPEFQPYDPTILKGGYEAPWQHKNPDAKLKWQDLEFSLKLLDKDEQKQLKDAVTTPRSVIITGGIGTGKTLIARYIHYHTAETAIGEFIEENFAAIPEGLLESIFRGVTEGAATGVLPSEGLLKIANNGTLFLDEIAEADKNLQAKLLRFVSERIEPTLFRKVGGKEQISSSVRFLAATNVPRNQIKERLRTDLYSRFPIRIRLKKFSEKNPDPFQFYCKAILHFTAYDLRYNPELIPQWDFDALQKLHKNNQLPDNFRDFRSFISRIWDKRGIDNPIWAKRFVSGDEIQSALFSDLEDKTDDSDRRNFDQSDISIHDMVRKLSEAIDLDTLSILSEAEIKDLVYNIKKLAIDLALSYHPNNKTNAMLVYGMRNYSSFVDLIHNPEKMHPDKPKGAQKSTK